MPLSLPQYPPVAGLKAKASQVIAWLAAIVAKFAAGLTSADMAADAGIKGSQLSNAAGTRITEGNLENGAVTNRVLKADSTAGSPLAAVNTNNVVDGAITVAKLAALAVIAGKVKVTTHQQAVVLPQNSVTVITPSGVGAPGTIDTIVPLAIYLRKTTGGIPTGSAVGSAHVETDSSGNIFYVCQTHALGLEPTPTTVFFKYIPAS